MTKKINLRRIIHNYTASDVDIAAIGKRVTIPAGGSFDLTLQYDLEIMTTSEDIFDLLNQGDTNFQIEDQDNVFYNTADGIALMEKWFCDEALNSQTLEGNDSLWHRTVTNHQGNPNQVLYVDNTGDVKEVPLGNDKEILTSNGLTDAPSFKPIEGSQGIARIDATHGFARNANVKNAFLYANSATGGGFESVPLIADAEYVGAALHLNSTALAGATIDIYSKEEGNDPVLFYSYTLPNDTAYIYSSYLAGTGYVIPAGRSVLVKAGPEFLDNPSVELYFRFV